MRSFYANAPLQFTLWPVRLRGAPQRRERHQSCLTRARDGTMMSGR